MPISDKDIVAAERLLWWIRFLDSKNRRSLKRTTLLLCVSPMANQLPRLKLVMDVADKTFGKVIKHVPHHIKEVGWPGAPNQMFQATLRQTADDDLLFIEPDAVPIVPDWFDQLVEEYVAKARPAKKCFMGAHVGLDQSGKPHMTGIGIYGWDWHRKAPMLEQARAEAWDTFACSQTIPNAHWTRRIQHIFNNPEIKDLSILNPKTVLFHQNKDGTLIRLLNKLRWKNELNGGKDPVTTIEIMTKYYHAENCNRRIKAGGMDFLFEPYEQFAGVWYGVFATENESQQAALDSVIGQPNYSITAISGADYEAYRKKKSPTAARLRRSQEPLPPASLGNPAEVAAVPSASVDKPIEAPVALLPATVAEVVVIEHVELSPTAIEDEPKIKKTAKRK